MINIKKQKAQKRVSSKENLNFTKKCVIKRKLKFQDYKNCLEVAQIHNKINHLHKNEIDIDNPKKFIKNKKLILKTQQRLKSERHNVLLEKLTRFLSSNDDKRMK